jgi:hypothetical protein
VQCEPGLRTHVNGQDVHLTTNLVSAILHIRPHFTQSALLWIDALCINQEDNVEKSGQIRFMKEIYQKAVDVIVWVGEAVDQSDLSMDLMAEADRYFNEKPNIWPPLRAWTRERLDDPSYAEKWEALFSHSEDLSPPIPAIGSTACLESQNLIPALISQQTTRVL